MCARAGGRRSGSDDDAPRGLREPLVRCVGHTRWDHVRILRTNPRLRQACPAIRTSAIPAHPSDGQSVSKSAAAAAHSKTQARNVCVPGRPSRQCGELRGVPSLWIDSKARAVPYGRYVALRFSDSVTHWPLPRVIRGTAGLCRRSLLKIPWPLIIQTVSQSPCRSRRRPDSHRHRRTGLWRYTRSCWRW